MTIPLTCLYCGAEFTTAMEFATHLAETHPETGGHPQQPVSQKSDDGRTRLSRRAALATAGAGIAGGIVALSGSGSAQTAIEITDWTELAAIGNTSPLDGEYILANDLDEDTNGYETVASQTANNGDGFDPIGEFTPPSTPTPTSSESPRFQNAFSGTFDGQGNTITGVHIARDSTSGVGLFAAIAGTEAEIRDVTLESVDITGDSRVGGGAGAVGNEASITNVLVSGTVEGKIAVGGVAGAIVNGDLTDVTSESEVYGGEVGPEYLFLGGVVGNIREGTIDQCKATGPVSSSYDSTGPNTSQIGGLAGFAGGNAEIRNSSTTAPVTGDNITRQAGGLVGGNNATIMSCEATGNIDAPNAFGVGGLIGNNSADVTDSTASGSVTGSSNTGGLIGTNDDATIEGSAATGNVSASGPAAGGLIGRTERLESTSPPLTIRSCYAAGDVDNSGQIAGGLIGENVGDRVVDSYARGDVTGETNVGALIGSNTSNGLIILNDESPANDMTTDSSDTEESGIYRSYAVGAVTATDSDGAEGGLVGSSSISIEQSYWDTETTGQPEAADAPGNLPASVKGLTTSEMQGVTPTGTSGNDTMGELTFTQDETPSKWTAVIAGEEINPTPTEDGYPILTALDTTNQLIVQEVVDPAEFVIDSISTNSPVEAGEQLEVTVTVQNTGDIKETQSLDLDVEALGSVSTSVSLDGGESTPTTFSLPTARGDADEYTVTVSATDDTAQRSINITAASPVAPYTNDNGVVDNSGVVAAVIDWQSGELNNSDVVQVITAWQTGQEVS